METLSSLGGIFAAVVAMWITLCFIAGFLVAVLLFVWPVLGFIVTPWQAAERSKTLDEKANEPTHATSGR